MNCDNVKAVGLDLFGTTIIGDNKFDKYLSSFIKKKGGDIKKANILISDYSDDIESYIINVIIKSGVDIKNVTVDEIKNLITLYLREVSKYHVSYKLLDFIKDCKNNLVSLFLISNLSSVYKKVPENLGIEKYFDFKLYSCDVGLTKNTTDLSIFEIAWENLKENKPNISKNEVLFIGDNSINDIKASKLFGFRSIYVKDLLDNLI